MLVVFCDESPRYTLDRVVKITKISITLMGSEGNVHAMLYSFFLELEISISHHMVHLQSTIYTVTLQSDRKVFNSIFYFLVDFIENSVLNRKGRRVRRRS
jgi:hypothetical protein